MSIQPEKPAQSARNGTKLAPKLERWARADAWRVSPKLISGRRLNRSVGCRVPRAQIQPVDTHPSPVRGEVRRTYLHCTEEVKKEPEAERRPNQPQSRAAILLGHDFICEHDLNGENGCGTSAVLHVT